MSPTVSRPELIQPRILNRSAGPPPPEAVYVGRPLRRSIWWRTGEHYGNPFSHVRAEGTVHVTSREQAIACHKQWLNGERYQEIEPERRRWVLKHVVELYDKQLVCWCHPLGCHAEFLLELAREAHDHPRAFRLKYLSGL